MRVRLRLIQSQGEERYAKLETEILDDVGKTLGRDRVDLSLEAVGRLVCGIHVDGERIPVGKRRLAASGDGDAFALQAIAESLAEAEGSSGDCDDVLRSLMESIEFQLRAVGLYKG